MGQAFWPIISSKFATFWRCLRAMLIITRPHKVQRIHYSIPYFDQLIKKFTTHGLSLCPKDVGQGFTFSIEKKTNGFQHIDTYCIWTFGACWRNWNVFRDSCHNRVSDDVIDSQDVLQGSKIRVRNNMLYNLRCMSTQHLSLLKRVAHLGGGNVKRFKRASTKAVERPSFLIVITQQSRWTNKQSYEKLWIQNWVL